MKVVLLGYMASGKSTIGKFLASRTFLPFVDLDEYIEDREKKSISEIFKEEGDIYFRNKEHKYLKELLSKKEDCIISLGGGTPCYAGNMDIITGDEGTKSVYLQANINTIVNRLQKNRQSRPLVASFNEEELQEFVAKHLFERRYFYEKANFKVKIDDKSIKEIVTELRRLLY